MTSGKFYDPVRGQCNCNHDAAYLEQEIAAKRWVHEYRESEDTGKYVLVCLQPDRVLLLNAQLDCFQNEIQLS
jgi:hypothetical protein